MTFPFVQRAVQRDLASVGARVGWVQLANIAGNAAGSLGTGLVSLHLLGTTGTMRLLAALSLALLLGWLWRVGGGEAARAAAGGWRSPLACAACRCSSCPATRPSGGACTPSDAGRLRRLGRGPLRRRLLPRRAGAPHRRARRGSFFITGFAQGTVPFLHGHVLLGALGPLLHPDPQRVLFDRRRQRRHALGRAGLARDAGGARGRAGRPGARARSREVAAARPEGAVAALLADPRVRLEYGDGRRALSRGDRALRRDRGRRHPARDLAQRPALQRASSCGRCARA